MYIKYKFLFLRSGCTFHIFFRIRILSSIHWKTYFNLQLGLFGLFSFAFLTAGSSELVIARNMTPAHQNQGSVFANFVCLNVNPLELKFAIFVTFIHTSTYILFGACSNLGHSVGKSRTSLLPDMPRPLPFASNLIMRMIRIEYNNDDYLIIMMRIVMITLIMMFTFSCVSPHKDWHQWVLPW